MSTAVLLEALADAFEAASTTLRQKVAILNLAGDSVTASAVQIDVIARARALHPLLGPRQAEVVRLLADAGPEGTSAGALSRAMGYDQPNTHLALQALVIAGLVEKDESTSPHTYRLTASLLQ
jgi:DNA-binding MarR family transcriptional regulator